MKWLIQLRTVLEQLCTTGFQGSFILLGITVLFMSYDETLGMYSALVAAFYISVFLVLYIIINSILISIEGIAGLRQWLSNK